MATDNTRTMARLRSVIALVRQSDSDMAIQTLQAFLEVAANPGIAMLDLTKRLGMTDATSSRAVSRLSEWERAKVPGLSWLVARENPEDRRTKQIELTTKGRALASKIAELIS